MRKYKISATSYYNLSRCHRRVYLDLYGKPEEKGEYSDFLQLLWERGIQIEKEIIEKIRKDRDVFEIIGYPNEGTFQKTLQLMQEGRPLIYNGVLAYKDKIGRPDLLEKVDGKSNLGKYHYLPCDIKSGRATKEKEGGDIKAHYADQLLFYGELLEKIQCLKPDIGKIIDVEGTEVSFSMSEYEDNYKEGTSMLESIVYDKNEPEPQISGTCKECAWSKHCLTWANDKQDPTLIFKIGKQKYALREKNIKTIKDLSEFDIADFLIPGNKIPRAGEKTLEQWKRRANVWVSNKPILYATPAFIDSNKEIFYDVEDDPTTDHIYLHGIIEINNGHKGEYKSFCAWDRKDEEKAARVLWDYINSLPEESVIYHYGSYEKTKINRLAEKYNLPKDTVEKFDRLRIDLYRELERSSDWPLYSYGIKSIATFLNFKWSAEDASGANSIVWYNDYRNDPVNNKDLLDKILTYNKEDCEAMIVVKEWLGKT